MGNSVNTRRFRANPIEVLILSAVSILFFRSVYNLVYDQPTFSSDPVSVSPIAANPLSEGRSPASAVSAQSFLNVDVTCDKNGDQETTASKVRLTGPLCGADSATDTGKLVKASISNTANKFAATVFTDVNAAKFSTDYIPLNMGKNPIHLEFSYRNGKVINADLSVVKN